MPLSSLIIAQVCHYHAAPPDKKVLVSASALSSAPGQLVTDVPANGWLRQEKTHTQAIKSSRFWGNLPIRGGRCGTSWECAGAAVHCGSLAYSQAVSPAPATSSHQVLGLFGYTGHISVIGHPVSAWWKQETSLHLIYYSFHKSRSVPTNAQWNIEAQRKCATHLLLNYYSLAHSATGSRSF